jgi:hypothetical protein
LHGILSPFIALPIQSRDAVPLEHHG